ncbi:hypothetical protein MUP95_02995 [bacterium]|nr:hypothetical protein [bacterium]
MNDQEVQKEIVIIKKMIEKTRRETAESGHFFMAIGIYSIICISAMGTLNFFNLYDLSQAVMIVMLAGDGLIGYITVFRKEKKEKVKSYLKTICYSIWAACAIPTIIIAFLFPYLGVISRSLVGVLSSLIMGIAVFSTGIIFESRIIIWSSLAWWAGALVMAFLKVIPQPFIMVIMIFIGWIMPGIILNKKYRSRSIGNESR